jgi:hypothetical protein
MRTYDGLFVIGRVLTVDARHIIECGPSHGSVSHAKVLMVRPDRNIVEYVVAADILESRCVQVRKVAYGLPDGYWNRMGDRAVQRRLRTAHVACCNAYEPFASLWHAILRSINHLYLDAITVEPPFHDFDNIFRLVVFISNLGANHVFYIFENYHVGIQGVDYVQSGQYETVSLILLWSRSFDHRRGDATSAIARHALTRWRHDDQKGTGALQSIAHRGYKRIFFDPYIAFVDRSARKKRAQHACSLVDHLGTSNDRYLRSKVYTDIADASARKQGHCAPSHAVGTHLNSQPK